ncbi:MAG: A24 family peptidase [Cellulosilyticaceae bacterium]
MLETIIGILVGVCVGKILNLWIYCISQEESINYESSYCIKCRQRLGARVLESFSRYFDFKTKRRHYKKNVDSQYIWIETLNAILYGVSIYNLGITLQGIMICILISFMIVLSVVDMRYMLLPTKVIVAGSSVAMGIRLIGSMFYRDTDFLLQGIWGGVVGYGILALLFFASVYLFKKESMGYGDVRYLGMIGVFTSWQVVLLTLFIGSLIGSVYGIIQLRVRKESEPFPFGPFMSLGALISIFYGMSLIGWYMNMCGFKM